jgi:hypothetical protein
MAKVTIDEVEYESDDFTDTQKNLLQEITINNNIQSQKNYELHCLKFTNETLVAKLKEELDAPEAEEPKKE